MTVKELPVRALREFTVDLEKWARGCENGESQLLNEDGFMCCLGFLGLACGLTPDEMREISTPPEVGRMKLFPQELIQEHCLHADEVETSDYCDVLMNINDNNLTTDQQKMERLKEKFAETGIEIKFVNVPEENK